MAKKKPGRLGLVGDLIEKHKGEQLSTPDERPKSEPPKQGSALEKLERTKRDDPPKSASVKVDYELYERVKKHCKRKGYKQPGRFINAVIEDYLDQHEEG